MKKLLHKFPIFKMQRLLSKISRPNNSSSNSISTKAPFFFSSPLPLKPIPNPFSRCQNGVSAKGYQQNGVFSSSWRFFSNANRRSKPPPELDTAGAESRFRAWRLEQLSRPNRSIDAAVIGLMVTNIAVYLLWKVASPEVMVKIFTISVENITSGRLHTLITSAFSHIDIEHLITNMFGLCFFGLSIEKNFGSKYLLKLYLSGAIVGSIFDLVYNAFVAPSFQREKMQAIHPSRIPTLGASGAVNAIILLQIFLFPHKIIYIDLIIPVPVALFGIYVIGRDLLRVLQGDQTVSGAAHLGGAAVAAAAWVQRRRRLWPPPRF